MAKQLEIIINPNPILRKKSGEVKIADLKKPQFLTLTKDMIATMLQKDGAGLAAPQIGKNIRLIIVRPDFSKPECLVMINPKIISKSWAKKIEDEGCLSVLDEKGKVYFAPVERHKKITCTYINEKGKPKKIIADEFTARTLQHEIDHLDGILFIDKIKNYE